METASNELVGNFLGAILSTIWYIAFLVGVSRLGRIADELRNVVNALASLTRETKAKNTQRMMERGYGKR